MATLFMTLFNLPKVLCDIELKRQIPPRALEAHRFRLLSAPATVLVCAYWVTTATEKSQKNETANQLSRYKENSMMSGRFWFDARLELFSSACECCPYIWLKSIIFEHQGDEHKQEHSHRSEYSRDGFAESLF